MVVTHPGVLYTKWVILSILYKIFLGLFNILCNFLKE